MELCDENDGFQKDVLLVEEQIGKLRIPVSPETRKYLLKRDDIHGTVSKDEVWFRSCFPSSMSDDHLISAGISQMKFFQGIAVMSLETSSLLLNITRGIMPLDVLKAIHYVVNEYPKESLTDNEDVIIILPVCREIHWGLFVAGKDPGRTNAYIYWGDSLNATCP